MEEKYFSSFSSLIHSKGDHEWVRSTEVCLLAPRPEEWHSPFPPEILAYMVQDVEVPFQIVQEQALFFSEKLSILNLHKGDVRVRDNPAP